ncbi:protein TsetseEP-like [Schistocerca americana]|uniref:protein TsetseEP-like n=1 Tax=Schistocerca americana TaxID=7009 RepID=UPI001F502869|nr:protein TsetseEP-like [Schistocerca americana]
MPSAPTMALLLLGTLALLYCVAATAATADDAAAQADAPDLSSEDAARAMKVLLKKKMSVVIKKKPHQQGGPRPQLEPDALQVQTPPPGTTLAEDPKPPQSDESGNEAGLQQTEEPEPAEDVTDPEEPQEPESIVDETDPEEATEPELDASAIE